MVNFVIIETTSVPTFHMQNIFMRNAHGPIPAIVRTRRAV